MRTEEHELLSVTEHEHGRIERRRGTWIYYRAVRDDGHVCNFARKRDAVTYLDKSREE